MKKKQFFQILASFGLEGSHSLQPITREKDVSHLPKRDQNVSKNLVKSPNDAANFPQNEKKSPKNATKLPKVDRTLPKTADCLPTRETIKKSRHSSGSR